MDRAYCSLNDAGVCVLPGICVPEDRCVTDAGCDTGLTCVGGRCLDQDDVDALPAPTHWGYIADPHMTPYNDARYDCFSMSLTISPGNLSRIVPARLYTFDDYDWVINNRPEPMRQAVADGEWTPLVAITPLPDGTYLFQTFEGTNDLNGDGAPDEDYGTRLAGDGHFTVSADAYARGRSRGLRLDEIGGNIYAEHATPLPWRMPLLPWGRDFDGLRDYTMLNTSLQGDLYVSERGLWTGTQVVDTEDGAFRRGNLMIGGAFDYRDMAPYLAELTEGCHCQGVGDEPYVSPSGEFASTFSGICREELTSYWCLAESERPYWCNPSEICSGVGPAGVACPVEADVDLESDPRHDREGISACFFPEIVPATVTVEGWWE